MPSTPFAYPQVFRRTFASFRVAISGIPQVSLILVPDSIPGSYTKEAVRPKGLACSRFHQHSINTRGWIVGWLRCEPVPAQDGALYVQVQYRVDGKQSSTSLRICRREV
jgi:hypothetical protein